MALTKDLYLTMVHEAENAPQFKNSRRQAWEAVGERLFDLAWNEKEAKLDVHKYGISFTAMLEATINKELRTPISLFGMSNKQFTDLLQENRQVYEAVVSGAFPTITTTIMQKTVIEAFRYHTAEYDALVSVHPWTGGSATKVSIPGLEAFDGMKRRPEGTPYYGTDTAETYVDVYMYDFGREVELTFEAVKTDQTGMLVERAQRIGEKGALHRNKMLVQSIEMVAARTTMDETATRAGVFNGTALTQAQFYSNDHSSQAGLDGQTNDNKISNNLTLDYDGLKEGWKLLSKMKDHRGDEIQPMPNAILCHTDYYIDAWEKINTRIGAPDTAENSANFFYNKYNVIGTPFLSDANSWYLGEFKPQVVQIEFDPFQVSDIVSQDDLFHKKIIRCWKAAHHFGIANRDYRYVVRSAGP
ncbi:MAG TPA: hypothetical protein ENH14_01575 [candidate division WOR-3 bacterium]|uniref:Phage major capsid protein n=1 Tax=candidate division WOR-3 bacterium TaxID=2052148 RepID=A0A7V0LUA7_UNCW3|nr:hypothetical protein [candidate division WOR-3 bacterium]